jgi:hypothetical protein
MKTVLNLGFIRESGAAKTKRVVAYLRQLHKEDPTILPLAYGINPRTLNSIKNYTELPELAVSTVDAINAPISLANRLRGYYNHYLLGL